MRAIAIDGMADRAAARDARAAEFRASRPWILLGWVTGIVVIWLRPGPDDLTTFFMALFAAYLVPSVVWLAIHRRLPEAIWRKGPYQASNAVVSILLCFTLPSLFRAFNPMTAFGPMSTWVIAGLVLIATYETWALVGVRWTDERRGFGPIQPDWRGIAILTTLVSAAIVGFAATNQLIAALPIIPWECAGPIEFCERLPPPLPGVQEPWVIAGFYGCLLGGVAAWWSRRTVLGFALVGAVYVLYVLWVEQAWKAVGDGLLALATPWPLASLEAGMVMLLIATVSVMGVCRRDRTMTSSDPTGGVLAADRA